jgi:hypothetical protein
MFFGMDSIWGMAIRSSPQVAPFVHLLQEILFPAGLVLIAYTFRCLFKALAKGRVI